MPVKVPYSRFAPTYTRPRYCPTDALSFCLASRLAYAKRANNSMNRAAINRQAKAWGFPGVESFEIVRGRGMDTQGFVAVNDLHVLVAFCGSESLPGWQTNLQAAKHPGPWRNTAVHEGFHNAFMAAALKIGEIIGRERQKRQQIWVTGHSLGGALAALLAATLLENKMPVHGLYTFGAPRVGDEEFAGQLNASLRGQAHWRVVNEGDMVPHVPPELFFSHAGKRKLLRNDGTVSESPDDWQDFKEVVWGLMGRMFGGEKLEITDTHLLDSDNGYLQRLAMQMRVPSLPPRGRSSPRSPKTQGRGRLLR